MTRVTRRQFVAAAAAISAATAWARAEARPSSRKWAERGDLYAEGVASSDPDVDSVILWTRVSASQSTQAMRLTLEVSEDERFERVVASARARALAAADHTVRVLVGGLKPAQTYWYRFLDEDGNGSRIGRTRTAPAADDPRPVKFAFVSCQSVSEGAQNAYRRMIHEDLRMSPEDQLAFVLHLGDFIYEVLEYPEDTPDGRRYDRRLRDVVRFPDGGKIPGIGFQIASTLADYRALYRAYLRDPDLQDARALAVRADLGQPRILVAWLAVHAAIPGSGPPRAGAKGRRKPGVVRVSAGANTPGVNGFTRAIPRAFRQRCSGHALR